MARSTFPKLARLSASQISPFAAQRSSIAVRSSLLRQSAIPTISRGFPIISVHTRRAFSTTRIAYKGLSPESEDPQPKDAEDHATAAAAAGLTMEQYNDLSDEYMNAMVEKLEQLQEEREDVDVEYSAGVLTFSFPPIGTYVINKQPPNKQIWLSSPISGPKRYDFVIMSEGQDSKEGTGAGDWVYLRDGSSLGDVLLKEVGVDLTELAAPVPHFGE